MKRPLGARFLSSASPPATGRVRAGICLGLGFLIAGIDSSFATEGAAAGRPGVTVRIEAATNRVGRYCRLDFALATSAPFTNAFDPEDIQLDVELLAPGGRTLRLPAFYGQAYERRQLPGERSRDWFYPTNLPLWRARFAPVEIGAFQAVAVVRWRNSQPSANSPYLFARSAPIRFESLASDRPGFVRVSGRDPRFLEFTDGRPFFPLGQNLAFIGNQQYVSLSKAEAIFGKLQAHGANYLRIWTCCEDWAMAIEARKSAWGRSWDWRAPMVPLPGGPGPESKCLKIDGAPLRADPSHPVALRPGTRYTLRGNVRTEPGTHLKLEAQGRVLREELRSDPGQWHSFQTEFETGPLDYWLSPLRFQPVGSGAAWLSNLSLSETGGGPELLWEADVNRPVRGFYNPVDCFMLDELIGAAERHGIFLQLCLLTRDLYMPALQDPADPKYEEAIRAAKRTFRYAVARWGYSTAVAAWEYWNEMDPGRPTDRFYRELGEHLDVVDVYRHLRTTSTWGPSARDARHPQLDFADVHFYLRPSDKARLADEVDAVLDRARWLREVAPNKPVHLGEFGLANEQWQPTPEMNQSHDLSDVHNALWASSLSGASGSALYWWWERLDQRNVYPVYAGLSAFLKDIPWNSGTITNAVVACSDPRVRPIGLRAGNRAWLWLFSRDSAWAKIVLEKASPAAIADVTLELGGTESGWHRVAWWDTRAGRAIAEDRQQASNGVLKLAVPVFKRDIACVVSRDLESQ